RIVVAPAEAHQLDVAIPDAAGEAKRLEAGVGVLEHTTVLVVVDPLRDYARCGVDHQPHRAQVVADDAVDGATFDQVLRYVGAGAVNETRHDRSATVELGDRVELVLV